MVTWVGWVLNDDVNPSIPIQARRVLQVGGWVVGGGGGGVKKKGVG